MMDAIISKKTGEILAEVEVQPSKASPYECEGVIIDNKFPQEFLDLLSEFDNAVEEGMFGVLDGFEARIYEYAPMLQSSGKKIFQLKIEGSRISFFLKYPSGKGYLDDFPDIRKKSGS
jgi:hypothetical protein